MAQNLRDRGYSSSMDGYQPKLQRQKINKAEKRANKFTERDRFNSRQKTVAPGEASVSKGEKVITAPAQNSAVARLPSPEQIRSTPISVPEYSPTYPTGLSPVQSQPLNFQMTDPQREQFYQRNIWSKAPSLGEGPPESGMSMEELKNRIDELNEAMWKLYRKRDGEQFRVKEMEQRASGDLYTNQHIPYYPTVDVDSEFNAANTVADYNWEVKEYLNDWVPDVTDDPVVRETAWQDFVKAANTGRYLKTDEYWNSLFDKKTPRIYAEEQRLSDLFNEYNNLKNEYNTRLARYLQSYGG